MPNLDRVRVRFSLDETGWAEDLGGTYRIIGIPASPRYNIDDEIVLGPKENRWYEIEKVVKRHMRAKGSIHFSSLKEFNRFSPILQSAGCKLDRMLPPRLINGKKKKGVVAVAAPDKGTFERACQLAHLQEEMV